MWPSLQIPLHCSWDIFNGFWIRTIRWADIHNTRIWWHLRLLLFLSNLLHDTRRWLHLRLSFFLKRLLHDSCRWLEVRLSLFLKSFHLGGLKCRLSTMCNWDDGYFPNSRQEVRVVRWNQGRRSFKNSDDRGHNSSG